MRAARPLDLDRVEIDSARDDEFERDPLATVVS